MRKTAIGIVVGGILVLLANFSINWWIDLDIAKRSAALQTADPADWLDVQNFTVDGVPPGVVPMAHIRFAVLKPSAVRTAISPRNLTTGESVCAGQIASLYDGPRPAISFAISMATLAGLESCDFPAGDYAVTITITPTDLETNVQIKPIVIDRRFSVSTALTN